MSLPPLFNVLVGPIVRHADRIREIPTVRRIQSSQFVRNATTLVVFTTAGQAATVVLAPLLSRLYSPDDFGAFGIMLTFIQAVGVACCLNYDSAVPTAATHDEGATLLISNIVLSLIISLLLGAVFTALILLGVAGYSLMPVWSAVLVVAALWFAAVSSAFHYFSMRHGEFRTMGEASFTTSLIRLVVQIVTGVLGWSWFGLALGEVTGRIGGVTRFIVSNGRRFVDYCSKQTPQRMWTTLVAYRQFPLILLPPTLADQILNTLYMPLITSLYGLPAAGQYFFMRRVLDLPMAVIARTVADAFHGRISEEAHSHPKRVRPFLIRVFLVIVVPAAAVALPVIVAGPSIFAFVFGEPWRQSGVFASLAVPALVVSLGASPVSRVFSFTSRPGLRSVFTFINGIGAIAVFAAAWRLGLAIETTAAALGAVSLLAYSSYFAASYVAAGHLVVSQNRA